jgi:hypothetical protein
MTTAKRQAARTTPEQLTYIVACELDVALAGLSPEQRLDVLKRLHDSILRRLSENSCDLIRNERAVRPLAYRAGVNSGLLQCILARQLVLAQLRPGRSSK